MADVSKPTEPTADPKLHKVRLDFIDWILLTTVVVVLIVISSFLIGNMTSQNKTYDQIIHHLMSVSTIHKLYPHTVGSKTVTDTLSMVDNPVNAAILSFARAKDFANIKLGSALLGFLLIFIGALYLLKVFNLGYKASLSQSGLGNVSIQTTSPGLVMITLGVIVMIAALISRNEVSYNVPLTDNAMVPQVDTIVVNKNTNQKIPPGDKLNALNAEIASLKKEISGYKKSLVTGPIPGMATSYTQEVIKQQVGTSSLFLIPYQEKKPNAPKTN